MSARPLSRDERLRYARHLSLPEVGAEGQARLTAARVLLVGAGGLGSPAALYLGAAGVGTLGIVDDDVVDLTNLQRQVLHGTPAVGHPKVESAIARLQDLNPLVQVEPHRLRLSAANAIPLFRQYDLVVDGSDNFPTRYLVNDAAILTGRPYVYGSIFRFEGQVAVFGAPGGPCYRCLYAEPPAPELIPSCAEAGVLGVLPGIIGSLQALEAIKLLLGIGSPLVGRLALFDGLGLRWREITVRRDPACPACGDRPSILAPIDYEAFCGMGHDPTDSPEILPSELQALVAAGTPITLLDVREPWEFEIAHLPGSQLIPLGRLPARVTEVPRDRPVVTVCHAGMRSLAARAMLLEAGLRSVRSLAGGVDAWAASVDPSMTRY